MKRNLTTVVSIRKTIALFSVIEKINTNKRIEIFSARGLSKDIKEFIGNCLKSVESNLNAKIKSISFDIEPTLKFPGEIKLHKESINIVGQFVKQQDVKNCIKLIENKFNTAEKSASLIQPLKFQVISNGMTKNYSQAPLHKQGDALIVLSAVTTINKKLKISLENICKQLNVNVKRITLSPQSLSQNNLSQNALIEGSALLHIDEYASWISLQKNGATIKYKTFYGHGIQKIIFTISKKLKCSTMEARKIFAAHCSIYPKINKIAYIEPLLNKDKKYYSEDIGNIIQAFIKKICFEVKTFLVENKLENLQLVISVIKYKIEGMRDFISNFIDSERTSEYRALSFAETNYKNWPALGELKLKEKFKLLSGEDLDTLVHTNPNTLEIPLRNQTLLTKIWRKIGGKNEWH